MINESSQIDHVAQSEARPELIPPDSLQLCVDAADPTFQAAVLIIALLLIIIALFALGNCQNRRTVRAVEDLERAAISNRRRINRELASLEHALRRVQFQETENKIQRLVQQSPVAGFPLKAPMSSPFYSRMPTAPPPPFYCSRSDTHRSSLGSHGRSFEDEQGQQSAPAEVRLGASVDTAAGTSISSSWLENEFRELEFEHEVERLAPLASLFGSYPDLEVGEMAEGPGAITGDSHVSERVTFGTAA